MGLKIAVAGGTGNVATELLRSPIASGNHEITIFTRHLPEPENRTPGISYKAVDYTSIPALTAALSGHDTCLSFLVIMQEPGFLAQKNLIDACILAGVQRFAPSEWGIRNNSGIAAYETKDRTVAYLDHLAAERTAAGEKKMKMQYTLFQPSIWLDYFAHPHPLSKGLITWPFFIDFENRRAMLLDEGDQPIVLTAIADVSKMLARVFDDTSSSPGYTWTRDGGSMRGNRTTIAELIALGKRIRGGEWHVENIRSEDIEKGVLTSSWVPLFSHPAIPEEMSEAFSKEFVVDFFKGILRGAWDTGASLNERYPDFGWTGAAEYLTEAWEGRP